MIIGPSTGYMYMNGIYSISQQEVILKESGSNAFEINLGPPSEIEKRLNTLKEYAFTNLGYRAFHISNYDKNKSLDEQVHLAQKVITNQIIKTALIHPDNVPEEFWEFLSDKIHFAIENMDKEKANGFDLKELEILVQKYDTDFVLDVQHAYEHDPNMKYAQELFDIMKYRIVHLHVSGQTPDNCHSLVHKADNKDQIINFTGKILSEKNVPIILEGEYKTSKELKEEIDFIRSELGLKQI